MERDGDANTGASWGGGAIDSPDAESTDYAQFVTLVPLHMGAVLRVAAALIGPADAEDAAQEAMLRGWQAWPAMRNPAAARGWLLRITVNVCKDWQRGRYGTHKRLDLPLRDDASVIEPALLDADPGASDAAASLDLRAALNELHPELRMVVLLRHYVGMDSNEIGAALGIPPGTVRTRLRRALTLLRERLSQSGRWPSAYTQEGGR
ncbi:MAG TPA: RNA polymerase sigma factor [Ktedonobacterales bacterium]|nr:RNA polymerase sigma factor [Ktedonobacterales bacterium]